ncbi:hypothetical protein Leryth_004997 [Lithospermum erythrorhizon]|nr:hypothetical protein Leryth_004997 [Lithospermum erythrorhizon]
MNMFELTAKANPAVLVSIGNVSLGINHPIGPHDHANDITNVHTRTTTTAPSGVLKSLEVQFPLNGVRRSDSMYDMPQMPLTKGVE